MTGFEDVFIIPSDHPSLPGHFPDIPVVPAALILDQALAAIERHGQGRVSGIRYAKFRSPLPLGTPCRLQATTHDKGGLAVSCSVDGELVLSAIFDRDPPSEAR